MAPVDRREHRQQRVRGAGPSSVQASFGFNFGALGVKSAKQASLPPQLSSRRTPVRGTPRGTANGSAQRHRSASVQRSGGLKSTTTPNKPALTPQLGKRKRGSPTAQGNPDEGEVDELSPDREETVRSVEKSRRVVGAISPIREELDDGPDELSVLEDHTQSVRKTVVENPTAVLEAISAPGSARRNGLSVSVEQQKTPNTGKALTLSVNTRRSIPRSSVPSELGAVTPGMLPNKRSRLSGASQANLGADITDPSETVEESEDELSPPKPSEHTTRVVSKANTPLVDVQEEQDMNEDELASTLEPSPLPTPVPESALARDKAGTKNTSGLERPTSKPLKRGRPPRAIRTLEEHNPNITAPIASRTPELVEDEDIPVVRRKNRHRKSKVHHQRSEERELQDELSPEADRIEKSMDRATELSGDDVETYAPEEIAEQEQAASPKRSNKHRPHKNTSSPKKPARKRLKLSGIKQAISVMRIKGSTVCGITIADTTRTILEENIDHRLTRMMEKSQNTQDPAKRKALRSDINMTLSFKESLNEKLLDLQDANDVLSSNFKKMKIFKRDNAELRREFLALQNGRQEIALEHDDVQAQYVFEKAEAESKSTLSSDMFDIEAAIQKGRKKALRDGREHEGPKVPLSMLLDMVSRDVASSGGGLLSSIKVFNNALERAAGWLEGRT